MYNLPIFTKTLKTKSRGILQKVFGVCATPTDEILPNNIHIHAFIEQMIHKFHMNMLLGFITGVPSCSVATVTKLCNNSRSCCVF